MIAAGGNGNGPARYDPFWTTRVAIGVGVFEAIPNAPGGSVGLNEEGGIDSSSGEGDVRLDDLDGKASQIVSSIAQLALSIWTEAP